MKHKITSVKQVKRYLGMACLLLMGFIQPYLINAQTFNGTTGAIPDSSTFDFTTNVTGLPGTIGTDYTITNVTVDIVHSWTSDLDISLVGPDGTTTLNLSDDNGDNGYNYTNTVFTDAASTNITAGFPPFAGSFNPEGPGTLASVFNGSAVNGIWTLRITDDLNLEEGTLLSWSITFQAVNPPVVLNCPSSTTTTACQTQSAVNNAFALWLLTASATGGCNGVLSNNNVAQGGAPPACGGSRTVTFTYTSSCAPTTTTCQATYTVPTAPTVTLTCPTNTTTTACQTQAAVDAAFATWLATASGTGGCNGTLTNNSVALGGAPPACGGSRTVTFIYTSTCGTTTTTCQATFTVPAAPTVSLTCPTNQTEAFGQTQAAINAKFATWLATASGSGGCGGSFTNNNTGAPPAAGGSVTVTFTKTSTCAPLTTTCQATFSVSSTPPVVLNCPVNATASSPCLTQVQLTAEYNAWLATATASGGCNGVLTNDGGAPPTICSATAIVKTVTFTYTSTCAPLTTTCQRTFTVPAYPDFNGPPNSGAIRVCLAQTEQPIPPVISDACGKPITPTGPVVVDAPNPLTCEGTRTYTFTYTDCAGHSKDWSFVWTLNVPTLSVDNPGTATVPCPSFTPPTYPNTITDACGRPVTVTGPTVTSIPNPITCEGTKTYTWNLTDCAGNTNTWSWIITIERNDFTLPANGGSTVNCPAAANVVPTPPSKMSECGEPIIPTGPVVSATPACEGTKTYTWTYTDCEGNSHDWVYTYTIERNDFTVPANGSATVSCPSAITTPTPPTVTSNCGETLTPTGPVVVNTPDPLTCAGTRVYTYTYTDCEGNTHPWLFTYTVSPTLPVTITCPTNTTTTACQTPVELNTAYVNWLNTASFSGGCDGSLTSTQGAPSVCGGSTTLTFTHINACGNQSCQATFTVPAPPPVVLNCPTNQLEAFGQTQAAINAKFATWLATATGNGGCNGVLTNNNTGAPPASGGTTTVTFTYTSSCAPLTTTCQATFTVSSVPPVVLTCPTNTTTTACQTQAAVNAAFATWLATASGTGGCNGVLTNNNTGAPSACGGSTTVTFTYLSSCAPLTTTCQAIFTVPAAPNVVLTCPTNTTTAACQTQAVVNSAFATWLATASASGGCNGVLTNNNTGAPSACGGSTTVTFTYTSTCAPLTTTCQATFTVPAAPTVVLTCPTNTTTAACQTQAAVNSAFATWLATAAATGGCNGVLTNNNTGAPSACGGSTTVTFTYTSTCAPLTTTCQATFTVSAAPTVVLTCPTNATIAANQTQSAINTQFATWLATASASGGCTGVLTNNNTGAPAATGGSTTVTFTYTSTCTPTTTTCQATFTVPAPVVLTCPTNTTAAACQTQAAVNTAFATWLATATASGGCNGVLTNNNTGAPAACGGSTTVTFTYTSACAPFTTTCQATFTVAASPTVVLSCPINTTAAACQTQAAVNAQFATWLATATASGGCNGVLTNNNTGAPSACGGSTTVTFTRTSSCAPLTTTCQATFTVAATPTVVLTCPINTTAAACQTQAAVNAQFAAWLATATASGGCNGVLTNNNTGAPSACGGSKTVTFTYTSTCAPLTTTCQATFTVTADVTAPTFTFCPPGSDLGINPPGVPAPGNANATDACSSPTITSALGTITSTGCLFSQTRTYTATDGCGNTATCTQLFTWITDVIPPTVVCQNATVSLNAAGTGSITTGDVFQSGADNCGTVNQVSVTPSSFTCADLGANTVTLLVNDGHGNTTTCTATVTVEDNILPTIVCPDNITQVTTNGECYAAVDFTPLAQDNCGVVNTEYNHLPNSDFEIGATSVQVNIADASGNTAQCQFWVFVVAAPEICDGLDNDCDGSIDESDGFEYFVKELGINPVDFNQFGNAVALDSSRAIVGIQLDDQQGTDAGAAQIYERNSAGQWIATKHLIANDASAGDQFGHAVAIRNNWALVAAHLRNQNGIKTGAVYVFERNTGGSNNWGLVTTLTPTGQGANVNFGSSLAFDGRFVVVGSNFDSQQGTNSGAAYIFDANNAWSQVANLTALNGMPNDEFGYAVAIANQEFALIGAPGNDSIGLNAGAAYLFRRNATSGAWAQVKKLSAANTAAGDQFGFSVALDGPTAVIGAPRNDFSTLDGGIAYVFERNRGGLNHWGEGSKLFAYDSEAKDRLGSTVAVEGGLAVVGAPYENAKGYASGSANTYLRQGDGQWIIVQKLMDPSGNLNDNLFSSLALSNHTILTGAPRDDEQGLNNNGSVLWFDAQCVEEGNMLIINDNDITQFENEFQEVSLKSPLTIYPVPFMSDVFLNFELAESSQSVSVVVTNAMGQVITTLHKGALKAGVHEMEWHTGESTPAGIYFLRIDAGAMQEVRRLIKVKE